jgi:hypothetical protein
MIGLYIGRRTTEAWPIAKLITVLGTFKVNTETFQKMKQTKNLHFAKWQRF